MLRPLLAAVLALCATPASAEVVARTADSFTLRYAEAADIEPDEIPGALRGLSRWWEPAHTYTGSAANLSLDLTPGGCWCEKFPDGTDFDHARTVSAGPDRFVFEAPFGPLRGKTTSARLTVSWQATNDVWTPIWTMAVEGPGIGAMADTVDSVMSNAYQRWLYFLENAASPPT
ncbi:hypothetical protein [Brevundimonas sp.]|uniref:hypothetical protein n=1 Tax=Brevundimonas sp. TaxID=1871086 RepID=UPI002FC8EBCD